MLRSVKEWDLNIRTARLQKLPPAPPPTSHSHCQNDTELSDLADSIVAGDSIEFYFQPIVRLAGWPTTTDIVGYEAFARFCSCCRPDTVLAEMQTIRRRVEVELSIMSRAMVWIDVLPEGVFLNLNVSALTLTDPGFIELVETMPLERIVFDVAAASGDVDQAKLEQVLTLLQVAGGRIAADDTGADPRYAHPALFHQNIVKIDRSIVADIDATPWKQNVANAFKGMAWLVGADVVAEGIETNEELNELRSQGIGLGQGHLISPPAPAASMFSGGPAS